MIQDTPPHEDDDRPPTIGKGAAATAGVVATAAALGVAELAAGVLPGARSLVLSVGDAVIDSVPGWLERAAIAALGTADKPVLVGGVLVVSLLVGAALGILARRRPRLAGLGIVAFAGLGVAAALTDDRTSSWAAVVAGSVGALAGIAALVLLLRAAARPSAPGPQDDADRREPVPGRPSPEVGRRPFLVLVGAVTAVAATAAVAGRWLTSSDRVEQVRAALRLPRPARPAEPVPADADLEIPGLAPLFTPNPEFYRIDTALTVPQIDPEQWSLSVGGMVDDPYTLTYDELLSMPQIEADITLVCVSNEVGGGLVGNARWQGVPLRPLLDRAGLQPGATQLLSRSVDGFTAGFPTITALDLEEAMVAVGMNGEPLPAVHGFPARLVVPGLYGYVSATKWLSSIELTTFEDEVGYWIPRGWAREGPIKTQSRIDVPRPSSSIPPGTTAVAGVAWAPTRGIERVEVRIDDGPWTETTLAARLDVDCWRQWVYAWDATPGRHVIAVRATDGAGEVQTDARTPVAPDGAAGRHTIEVLVEG